VLRSHRRGVRSTCGMGCSFVASEPGRAISGFVSRASAGIPSHKSAKIDIIHDLPTYKTCLLTLRSSLTSPILESKASSRSAGSRLAWGSALVGAPYCSSSYLSPPGLRICREMPWSFASDVVAVAGLVGAWPTAPDSACALRDAGEPYTENGC